jgi:hypothetical protein
MQVVSTIYSCLQINTDVSNMSIADTGVTRPALGLNNRQPPANTWSRLFGEGWQGGAIGLPWQRGIAKIAGVDFIGKTVASYQGGRDMHLKSEAHLKRSRVNKSSPPYAA